MLLLPSALAQQFDLFLDQQGLSRQNKAICLKWLRFYWDFCAKYQHDPYLPQHLSFFLDKLRAKQQSELQLRQARQTVIWFYRLHSHVTNPIPDAIPVAVKRDNSQAKVCAVTLQQGSAVAARAADIQPHASQPSAAGACSWVSVFDSLHAEIMLRHYSPKTLKSYRGWARHFQTFTRSKDSQTLTQQDGVDFLTHLAVNRQVSASTQNQAFNALLFLYKHVLHREFGEIKGVARTKRRPYLPVVLSRTEIDLIVDHLTDPVSLIAQLSYGCGLRLFECLKLRVGCLNFDTGVLTVHDSKGQKDRSVPMPDALVPALKKQLTKIFQLYDADLKARYAGVFLPDQVSQKYPKAAQEISWQWLFPAHSLTLVVENGEYRRYHLHESVVQKAIKQAVRDAKIIKRASAHSFRHSFASHLLAANYDIRTIQELLGHSDIRTTMIYTHTVQSRTLKEVKSPLDFDS